MHTRTNQVSPADRGQDCGSLGENAQGSSQKDAGQRGPFWPLPWLKFKHVSSHEDSIKYRPIPNWVWDLVGALDGETFAPKGHWPQLSMTSTQHTHPRDLSKLSKCDLSLQGPWIVLSLISGCAFIGKLFKCFHFNFLFGRVSFCKAQVENLCLNIIKMKYLLLLPLLFSFCFLNPNHGITCLVFD